MTSPSSDRSHQDTRTTSKRPRPVLSCLECRRKKLKCDRLLPCQQCLKLGHPSLCVYAPGQEPELRGNAQSSASSPRKSHADESRDNLQLGTDNEVDLLDRVRKLEEALKLQQTVGSSSNQTALGTVSAPKSQSHPTTSTPAEEFSSTQLLPDVDDHYSIFNKFQDVQHFISSLKQRSHNPAIQAISSQLFSIDRAVSKSERAKPTSVATYRNLIALLEHMTGLLPAHNVCDKLIKLYFEHFEHCARILHKPRFLLQNQQYFNGTLPAQQSEYFIAALLGVLCTASSLNIRPECDLPKFDGSRDDIGAIQLLNNWYELIVMRDGPTIPAIQVKVLVIKAQQYQNTNAVDLWVANAQLVRQAMSQHLHQEPASTMINHEAEIRRCLWLTILEQDLALAIWCEMPPLCPSYDLRLPANCDDHELSEITTEPPPCHPISMWTDGLCQHILGQTFNRRLEAYKHRFAIRTPTHYSKTLEYTHSLELTLQSLPSLFRLDNTADHAANTPGRLMAQMDLDIALRRVLIATYAPYARATPTGNVYREVRIPWVHSHIVVMCFQDLFDPQFPMIDVPRPIGYWDFFFTAYEYDATQSLEAMLLEGKYLKDTEIGRMNQVHKLNDQSTWNSPTKAMRWDFKSMVKSAEDGVGPMSRRLRKSQGDLRSLVKYNLLLNYLQSPTSEEMEKYLITGLQDLISGIRRRLESEGYNIYTMPNWQSNPTVFIDWLVDFLDTSV